MIGFLLLMGISNAAAIGFCAAGYSVANMKVPERTPEEKRKDRTRKRRLNDEYSSGYC
ncbi:hypothetical protein [Kandleria sp.]|uniref:hypothetical protein n=1 Tax=Kandleria sp. TaxID=2774291 RepID=UPI001B52175C|nr:hypothetical protein [Kandleria sp.]MBP3276016.1 hypothetical protein [Kandleria sp.]